MENKIPKIIIVGGAQSAAGMLMAMNGLTKNHPTLLPLEIEVIEAGHEFASGLAWSASQVRPWHALNSYLNRGEEDRWIRKAGGDETARIMAGHKPIELGETSRLLGNQIAKREFNEAVDRLRERGVKVRLTSNAPIVDIDKHPDGYTVTTKNGEKKNADFVVVATGHWQNRSKVNDNAGVLPSPWPASRLEEIDSNQPIAVLGTSLSAVDAILTLAHKAGTFSKSANGKVTFTPHKANAGKFKVMAYSPHGMLPSVLASRDDNDFMKREYERLHSGFLGVKDGFTRLDDIYDMIKHDFRDHHVSNKLQPTETELLMEKIFSDDSLKIEDAAKLIYKAYHEQGATKWLQQQVAAGKRHLADNTILPWQQYLRTVADFVEGPYNYLSAEDLERFSEIRTLIAKLMTGMVMSNAEEILALMESGCLEVHATGNQYSLGTRQEGDTKLPGAEIRYEDETGKSHADYYRAVVRASGDDPYQLKTSSPLMKKLFDSGMAEEVLMPYKDQELGRREYEKEQQTAGEQKVVRLKDGQYYRSAGGISVNPNTYELLPADENEKQHNLFTLGPPLTAHLPLFQGLGPIGKGAKIISTTIGTRILEQRHEKPVAEAPETAEPKVLGILRAGNSELARAVVTGRPDEAQIIDIRALVGKRLDIDPAKVEIVPASSLPAATLARLRAEAQQQI